VQNKTHPRHSYRSYRAKEY